MYWCMSWGSYVGSCACQMCISLNPCRRYESQVVKQLIVNDGGSGSFVEVRPEVLGIFDTLLTVRHRFI